MNLIIDVGNSYVKLAVFKNKLLHSKTSLKINVPPEILISQIEKFSGVKNVMISSVSELSLEVLTYLKNKFKVLELSANLRFPYVNTYKTPLTLGVDRLALSTAASIKYPNSNVLVIDAGTCITFDIINASNQYLGGAISPGLTMRYNALHKFTSKLPLLDVINIDQLIGNDTNTSIHSGVINGVISEIDGVISRYKSNFDDLTIVLSGGDAEFLSLRLKNSIFANSNFLLDGLNYLLEFNLD